MLGKPELRPCLVTRTRNLAGIVEEECAEMPTLEQQLHTFAIASLFLTGFYLYKL
jgi:hypothetical protein